MNEIYVSNSLQNGWISANTKQCYHKEIESFLNFTKDQGLSLDQFGAFIDGLELNGKSVATLNKHISAIRSMIRAIFLNPDITDLQKYQLENGLKEIPFRKKSKNSSAIGEDQILSKADIELLISQSPNRTGLIIRLLYSTGLRISELCGIKLNDCKVNGNVEIRILGKGKKERKIRISKVLYQDIIETFHGKEYLFESATGKPLHDRNIDKELRRLGKKILGKEGIHAHLFRHCFASHKITDTNKIKAVSEYLGHSSTSITLDMYVHETLSDEELGLNVL